MESGDTRCTYHDALIVIIPSIRSSSNEVVSALELCDTLMKPFIDDIMDVISEVSGPDSVNYVNFLDISQFNIDSTRTEEEKVLLFTLLHQMCLPYLKPLICFIPLGMSDDDKSSTIHMAWKVQESTDIDTVILNIDNPVLIHEATGSGISYIIGTGGTRYQTRNVIVNGHKGPLLSTEQVLDSLAQGGQKIGKYQEKGQQKEVRKEKD